MLLLLKNCLHLKKKKIPIYDIELILPRQVEVNVFERNNYSFKVQF